METQKISHHLILTKVLIARHTWSTAWCVRFYVRTCWGRIGFPSQSQKHVEWLHLYMLQDCRT